MSKLLVLFSLIFTCSLALAYDIDLSGGRADVSSKNEISLRNVKFGGINAVWAKLVWNPELNAFKLVEFGDERGQNYNTALVGTWTLSFDWYCRGNKSAVTVRLNEDGTCMDSMNNSCRWSYENSEFLLDYGRNIGALYRGALEQNGNLRGTMSYRSETGCWSAIRTYEQPVSVITPVPVQRVPMRPPTPVRP